MDARMKDNGEFSENFPVTNGVKQGCVLAPTLFSMLDGGFYKTLWSEMSKVIL